MSSVRAPEDSAPVMLPASSVTDVMDGAFGAVVSAVTLKLLDAELALPATSITFAFSA